MSCGWTALVQIMQQHNILPLYQKCTAEYPMIHLQ